MEKNQVHYKNYIGDGDSKTYYGILKAAPYGEINVVKKERIGHIQKRMGSRLRDCVKKNNETVDKGGKKVQKKVLAGKGKLTGKVIDKLTVYYGLAFRRHCDSGDLMYNAQYATYYHYCSNTASNTLSTYKHNYLSPHVFAEAFQYTRSSAIKKY